MADYYVKRVKEKKLNPATDSFMSLLILDKQFIKDFFNDEAKRVIDQELYKAGHKFDTICGLEPNGSLFAEKLA